jgi:20S proteasome alpha/beta subunit
MIRPPKRPARPPRETDMTLCIAAGVRKMDAGISDGLVCCWDLRVETEHASSDTGSKFRKVSEEWAALLAGDTQKADRLLDLLAVDFKGRTIDRKEAISEIRRVVAEYKSELVNEYIQGLIGLSYEDLRKNRATIPEAFYLQVFEEITRVSIGCDLILMNLKYKTPFVFHVYSNGMVDQARNFCAIGTGAPNAESWLHYRQQSLYRSLAESVLSVFEAKKFAEHAPGVGKKTRLAVIGPHDRVRLFGNDDVLSKMWDCYGPQAHNKEDMAPAIDPTELLDGDWEHITAD